MPNSYRSSADGPPSTQRAGRNFTGPRTRLTPKDVAQRLGVGTRSVYSMLEQGILPGIRVGQRWLITTHAYDQWERTCGTKAAPDTADSTGLNGGPEVTVN